MFLIEEKLQSEVCLSAGEGDEIFPISGPAVVECEAVSILRTGEILPPSSPGSERILRENIEREY